MPQHMCEVGGQLVGLCSLLLSCGPWGLNSGYHIWQRVSLPAEPSLQPETGILRHLTLPQASRGMLLVFSSHLHLFFSCCSDVLETKHPNLLVNDILR